ncbi:hypothetical protein TrCOL_g12148 [Triparma columacea]|uniref:NADP-dependent oxidoreductase domain-containing protein n=1 Tax=Triparma columacea TaxID=722753 RepID=A0A9W7G1H2_9STRA|nr:hypothetical protein TrCOL_g12148 [Triparma columacea]
MIKFLLYTISCAILYNILLCNLCNAYTPDITRRHAIKVATLSLSGLPTLAQSANADTLLLPKATASTASTTSQLQPSVTIKDGKAVLPKLGTGAWAWGDSLFWGYNPKEDSDLQEVFNLAVSSGNGFFDTAELYGLGRSESLISDFTSQLPPSLQSGVSVATKFAPLPWKTTRQDVVKAAKASVARLGGNPIDLYQIHFPNAYSNSAYWDGLADCYDQGLIRSCGVSNYGKDAVRAVHARLKERGIPLSSNQIQMSLIYRPALTTGLKDVCDELGVQTIAYSPLGLGLLTGKYRQGVYPKGPRKKLAEELFKNPDCDKLFDVMKEVGRNHDSASLSQVAINWAITKSSTAIPGARNLSQAKSNLAALDWKMEEGEVRALDKAAEGIRPVVDPEKSPFPKFDKDTGLRMFDC